MKLNGQKYRYVQISKYIYNRKEFTVLAIALYFASADDVETLLYFLVFQEMREDSKKI